MEQFDSIVNKNLGWVHENKYVLPVLSLFLGMYAALARPKLPNFIAKLFVNPVFRLVIIAYICYRGNKDPQLSLMIAAAFLITMHMINKKQIEQISLNQCGDSTNGGIACGPALKQDSTGGNIAGGLGQDSTGGNIAGGLGQDSTGGNIAGGLGQDSTGGNIAGGLGQDSTGGNIAGGLGRKH